MISKSARTIPSSEDGGTSLPLYEQVAQSIAALINSGTLSPGQRVPSVRQIHTRQKVSISTAIQAYRVLENRGVIEARPQSGYYVKPKRWVQPAEPEMTRPYRKPTKVKVSDLVMEVIHSVSNPKLVRLGATMPSAELFPTLELNRTMAAAGRRNPHLANAYEPPPGLLALRSQIARRSIDAGCAFSPDDIIITSGATEALNLCLRAVAKMGDTIAIESPTFFGFLQTIEALGMKACEIPTYPREGICLDALETSLQQCKIKACLFTLTYSNPLGSCMPETKKKALVDLLTRYDVPLIEDDIYGNLGFTSPRPKAAKAFDSTGLVMLVDSFTKTLAPGFRVGWAVPGRYKKRVEHLKFTNTSTTAMLPQMGIADYLAQASFEHHLRKVRKFYAQQVASVTQAISCSFPEGTRISRPQGGQVLWVELPPKIDALELYREALAKRISIAPGPIFSPAQRFTNCIRISTASPWTESLQEAILTIAELTKKMLV